MFHVQLGRANEGASDEEVADHLSPQDIQLDLEVSTKRELFAVIGQHMQRAHAMPQESVVLSLSRREQTQDHPRSIRSGRQSPQRSLFRVAGSHEQTRPLTCRTVPA